MIEIENTSDRETILSHSFQLQYLWAEDHWRHELISCAGCQPIPRIWSVGAVPTTRDHRDTRSPFYQTLEVHRDDHGLGRATLAGRSGAHRYAAHFVVEERENEVTIEVDVTDDCQDPEADLAVTYLIESSDGKLTVADTISIAWHHPECRIVFEADAPAVLSAEETDMGIIRLQASTPIDRNSRVQRLKYRWRWISMPSPQLWDRVF